jgi:acyl carrier protein
MMDREIITGIAEVARDHLDWQGQMQPDTRLIEDLGLDSLRMLTLAVEVENRFRVRLDPERDHELETVKDLVDAIQSQLAT